MSSRNSRLAEVPMHRRSAFAATLLMLLLLAASPAQAQSGSARYRFTTLLDSQDGLVPTRCAAINGLGTVAVQVEDTALGFNKLVTKRGHPTLRWSSPTRTASRTIRPSATTASPQSRRTPQSTSWAKWPSRAIFAGSRARSSPHAALRRRPAVNGKGSSSARAGRSPRSRTPRTPRATTSFRSLSSPTRP